MFFKAGHAAPSSSEASVAGSSSNHLWQQLLFLLLLVPVQLLLLYQLLLLDYQHRCPCPPSESPCQWLPRKLGKGWHWPRQTQNLQTMVQRLLRRVEWPPGGRRTSRCISSWVQAASMFSAALASVRDQCWLYSRSMCQRQWPTTHTGARVVEPCTEKILAMSAAEQGRLKCLI